MDPTTTLFTFMLQTRPSVKVVHLIGSWDNFTRPYAMERDAKRARGQWRGCYSFKDIVCEGEAGSVPKRNGGLKMGHTYYYYYELDGVSETHDPSQPSTNTCPYLPGQTVNTLWIPVERSGRKRSASLTSLREEDFKTMDPASKFLAPRPAPPPPEQPRRLGTALPRLQHQKRSPSPAASWIFSPRKLFSRKSSSSSLRETATTATPLSRSEDERSLRSEGSRSRDISPESLRRFLVEDAPLDHHLHQEHDDTTPRTTIAIPEDIVEENEDDDNFATSAASESMPEFGGLYPPPPQRALSASMPTPPSSPYLTVPAPAMPTRAPPRAPTLETANLHQSSFPISALCSPPSRSPDLVSLPGFDHSDVDDGDDDDDDLGDEALPAPAAGANPFARNLTATLSTYSLPRTAGGESERKLTTAEGELVGELGWMAAFI
ncbi:hypothetical protein VTI74DRAFT_4361 [Chaetomium olivicolor]